MNFQVLITTYKYYMNFHGVWKEMFKSVFYNRSTLYFSLMSVVLILYHIGTLQRIPTVSKAA